jgi:hypothetical protein
MPFGGSRSALAALSFLLRFLDLFRSFRFGPIVVSILREM